METAQLHSEKHTTKQEWTGRTFNMALTIARFCKLLCAKESFP